MDFTDYVESIRRHGYDVQEYMKIYNEIVNELVKNAKGIHSMIKNYDELTDEYAEFILDIAHKLSRKRLNGE